MAALASHQLQAQAAQHEAAAIQREMAIREQVGCLEKINHSPSLSAMRMLTKMIRIVYRTKHRYRSP